MFLLDTSVVAELRRVRSGKANPGVAQWAYTVPSELMFLSVLTVQELELAIHAATRRSERDGQLLRTWLDGSVLPAFRERILDVTLEIARKAATLQGTGETAETPPRNALIAATASRHGLTVVSRHIGDFQEFSGVAVTDPWSWGDLALV